MDYKLFKYCRLMAGLTQKELANAVGCDNTTICKIEKNATPLQPDMQQKVLKVFAEAGIDTDRISMIQTMINKK
jgi:DNA-binding XRE family transcriptional regulator